LGGSGTLTILTVSATLGGAVFGDHISPISDTTILASAGAECNHVEHVNTQLPYASAVAVIAILAYVVAGACVNLGSVLTALIMWVVALGLFVGFVFAVRYLQKKKGENEETEMVESTQEE
jgi:Na+/H+ antiporter NhaC